MPLAWINKYRFLSLLVVGLRLERKRSAGHVTRRCLTQHHRRTPPAGAASAAAYTAKTNKQPDKLRLLVLRWWRSHASSSPPPPAYVLFSWESSPSFLWTFAAHRFSSRPVATGPSTLKISETELTPLMPRVALIPRPLLPLVTSSNLDRLPLVWMSPSFASSLPLWFD